MKLGRTAGALSFIILSSALAGCAPERPAARAPVFMPQAAVATLDQGSIALLERCARNAEAQQAGPAPDALAAVARQRLGLVQLSSTLETARVEIDARIQKARKAARALAQSDREGLQIAAAIIDLEEGRAAGTVPKRIAESDAFRDLVDAHALESKNRAETAKVEAQLEGVDQIFASLGQADVSTFPGFGMPPVVRPASGRPIEPAL